MVKAYLKHRLHELIAVSVITIILLSGSGVSVEESKVGLMNASASGGVRLVVLTGFVGFADPATTGYVTADGANFGSLTFGSFTNFPGSVTYKAIEYESLSGTLVLIGESTAPFKVFRSTDGAETWAGPVNFPNNPYALPDLMAADDSGGLVVIADGFEGRWTVSDDTGQTWADIESTGMSHLLNPSRTLRYGTDGQFAYKTFNHVIRSIGNPITGWQTTIPTTPGGLKISGGTLVYAGDVWVVIGDANHPDPSYKTIKRNTSSTLDPSGWEAGMVVISDAFEADIYEGNGPVATALSFHDRGLKYLPRAGGGGRLWLMASQSLLFSDDKGVTWSNVLADHASPTGADTMHPILDYRGSTLTEDDYILPTVVDIEQDPNNLDRLVSIGRTYAGREGITNRFAVYSVSTDGGTTWGPVIQMSSIGAPEDENSLNDLNLASVSRVFVMPGSGAGDPDDEDPVDEDEVVTPPSSSRGARSGGVSSQVQNLLNSGTQAGIALGQQLKQDFPWLFPEPPSPPSPPTLPPQAPFSTPPAPILAVAPPTPPVADPDPLPTPLPEPIVQPEPPSESFDESEPVSSSVSPTGTPTRQGSRADAVLGSFVALFDSLVASFNVAVQRIVYSDTVGVVIAVSGLIAGTALATTQSVVVPNAFSSANIAHRLNALGVFVGWRRRKYSWGTVYDSHTKQPLDPAVVTLYNSEGKEVASALTDLDGRYGFLVDPGTYHITAAKTNYTFPSVKLSEQNSDTIYENLYFGQPFTVEEDKPLVIRDIPLDPIAFDWNEAQKSSRGLTSFYSKHDVILEKVTVALITIGAIWSVAAYLDNSSLYNTLVLVAYAVLIILRLFGKPQSYGKILERGGEVMKYAIIRVFQASTNTEVRHTVTDKLGRYFCLVPRGVYYMKIDEQVSPEQFVPVHTTGEIKVKKGVLKKVVRVE